MASPPDTNKLSELHAVCAAGDSDLLLEMISSGKYDSFIDYKDPDWDDRTPLHWCCIRGRGDMVRALLEKGAHPGLRTCSGWTPAHFAAECGRAHILRVLHQYNAPLCRRDISGDSPLRLATIYGHKEAIELLQAAEKEEEKKRGARSNDDDDVEWCRSNGISHSRHSTYVTTRRENDVIDHEDDGVQPAVTSRGRRGASLPVIKEIATRGGRK